MTAVTAVTAQRFAVALAAVSLAPFVAGPILGGFGYEPAVWSVAVVVFGAPHVGTTLAFYFDRELAGLREVQRDRFYRWPLLAVLVGVAAGFTAPTWVVPYLVAGFLAWQLHHFTRQNLGCFAFLCRARHMPGPSPLERRVLDLTTVAGVLAIPSSLVPLPGGGVFAVAGLFVLGGAGVLACRAARGADPARVVALGFGVVFYLPLFLFDGGPALLGYALAHGAQYLLMVGHLPAGRADTRRMVLSLIAGFVLIGLPLYAAMSHVGEPVIFGLFYGVTASHFLIDAGVWKMRTSEQRAYMQRRFSFL